MYSIVYVFITAGIEASIETSVDGHLTLKSLLGLERECEFCSHLTYLQLENDSAFVSKVYEDQSHI